MILRIFVFLLFNRIAWLHRTNGSRLNDRSYTTGSTPYFPLPEQEVEVSDISFFDDLLEMDTSDDFLHGYSAQDSGETRVVEDENEAASQRTEQFIEDDVDIERFYAEDNFAGSPAYSVEEGRSSDETALHQPVAPNNFFTSGIAFAGVSEGLQHHLNSRITPKRKLTDVGDIMIVQPSNKGRPFHQQQLTRISWESSGGSSSMYSSPPSCINTQLKVPGSDSTTCSEFSATSSMDNSMAAFSSALMMTHFAPHSETFSLPASISSNYSRISQYPGSVSINSNPGGSIHYSDSEGESYRYGASSGFASSRESSQNSILSTDQRSDPGFLREMELISEIDDADPGNPLGLDKVDFENFINLDFLNSPVVATNSHAREPAAAVLGRVFDSRELDDDLDFIDFVSPERTGISGQFSLASLDDYDTSPKAIGYNFHNHFLTNRPESPMGPALGIPLTRKLSLYSSPDAQEKISACVPSNFYAGESASAQYCEYRPWISSDATTRQGPSPSSVDNFVSCEDEAIRNDFSLLPFRTDTESLHKPEPQESLKYFPESMLPFQEYPEFKSTFPDFTVDLDKMLQDFKDAEQGRALAKTNRLKTLSKTRHSRAVEYSRMAAASGLIEAEWISACLVGDVPLFSEVSVENWSVKRGFHFITAVVSSIVFDPHYEEVLEDFLRDFFLPRVVRPTFEAATHDPRAKQELSRDLANIAIEMIANLISPALFDRFIEFTHRAFTFEDADSLYKTLHDAMMFLSIPRPYKASSARTVKPIPPDRNDPLYLNDQGLFDSALLAFQEEFDAYTQETRKFEKHRRNREDEIRVKRMHKMRSFEFLKVLVTHLAEPIVVVDSKWTRDHLLKVPVASIEQELKGEEETKQDRKHKKSSKKRTTAAAAAKTATAAIEPKQEELPRSTRHENQDFFDALFFAPILRAVLMLGDPIDFIHFHLDPFLKAHRSNGAFESHMSISYLRTVNRFISITRFNVVANCLPKILDYRRYILAYLVNNGAYLMGAPPKKIQSQAITLGLLNLFESVHLYQIYGPLTEQEREDRLMALLRGSAEIFQYPIIFLIYNPMDFTKIARVIELAMKEKLSSPGKLQAYAEIFAMTKNIDLLPIAQRKVIQYKPSSGHLAFPIVPLQSHNSNYHSRTDLPGNYRAIYNWNMPRRFKSLFEFEKNRSSAAASQLKETTNSVPPKKPLQHPGKTDSMGTKLTISYWNYAARILLARQFGISFDAANYKDQQHENITWLECIGLVNFFLEREAQAILSRASGPVNSELYQVFGVIDSQESLHRSSQLPRDEPTHFVNLFINSAATAMDPVEFSEIISRHGRKGLFDLIFETARDTDLELLGSFNASQKASYIRNLLLSQNPEIATDVAPTPTSSHELDKMLKKPSVVTTRSGSKGKEFHYRSIH